MQKLLAIIGLTWKAAFRYRLFWVIVALVLGAVVGVPLLIKDDGTAQGLTQIVITYTLGSVSALLGLCTLWLACGTLARDVEECQMQLVAVKPVARWQIWLGKWLGLVSLNAVLLLVAGVGIYGLLEWRARKLPADQQRKLENEVLVARAAVREEGLLQRIEAETERRYQEQEDKNKLEGTDKLAVKQRIAEQVKLDAQVVGPGSFRWWVIQLGRSAADLRGQPLYLRVKFNSAQLVGDTYLTQWAVGNPQKRTPWQSPPLSLAPDTFHEIQIPADLFDDQGELVVFFQNPNNVALLFSPEEGFEVLYREGGFALNFLRGLAIILCWMSLLATIGLASASFLSFPVAAFASLALLTMALFSGTMADAVSSGTVMGIDEESGVPVSTMVDSTLLRVFRAVLWLIHFVRDFSPIDSLSTGRSIAWTQLGLATAQIVLLLGGIIGGFGMFVFNRRELATAQGAH